MNVGSEPPSIPLPWIGFRENLQFISIHWKILWKIYHSWEYLFIVEVFWNFWELRLKTRGSAGSDRSWARETGPPGPPGQKTMGAIMKTTFGGHGHLEMEQRSTHVAEIFQRYVRL